MFFILNELVKENSYEVLKSNRSSFIIFKGSKLFEDLMVFIIFPNYWTKLLSANIRLPTLSLSLLSAKSHKSLERYEPGSTLATSFLYDFCQPVSRRYNHWFWSGGCRSSSCGFASTTGPRNFKLLFGFWSGEVRWIWSSSIQILLEVIAIGISSSPSLKYYLNLGFSVTKIYRYVVGWIFLNVLNAHFVEQDFRTKCTCRCKWFK